MKRIVLVLLSCLGMLISVSNVQAYVLIGEIDPTAERLIAERVKRVVQHAKRIARQEAKKAALREQADKAAACARESEMRRQPMSGAPIASTPS